MSEERRPKTRTLQVEKTDSAPLAAKKGLGEGSRLAEYLIEGKLGEGGMGVVFKARDPDLGRPLAIKLLHRSSLADHSSGQERLIREAQGMARLCHPNVVTVYHVGTYQDSVFIAMEFVDGGTLREWLQTKERSVGEILEVWAQAGRGLAAAHNAGLVHRDFKPDNALIGKDGRVRVTDFGLVTIDPLHGDPSSISGQLEVSLTVDGTVIGTPAYMAPEQHESQATDARTDQFAFCISLYEALFGYRPFVGATYPALVGAVLTGEIRAFPEDTAVPIYVQKILLRGLSTTPDDRFASIAELLEALGQCEAESGRGQEKRVDEVMRARVHELGILQTRGRLKLGLSIADEIRDQVFSSNDDELAAMFLLNSAALYTGLFRFEDADSCLRQCIPVAARANRPEIEAAGISRLIAFERDPQVAAALVMSGRSAVARADSAEQDARFAASLGIFYMEADRFDEARAELHRSLEIWHRELRKNSSLTTIGVWAHVKLAELQDAQGKDDCSHYLEALRIAQAADYQHPMVAAIHFNVGISFFGDAARSVPHYQQALAMYTRCFGEWDERVGMSLSALGEAMVTHGEIDEGIRMLKRGLEMSELILGEDDLQVATALCQLGLSMVPAQIEGAQNCVMRCIEIRRATLESNDPSIAQAYNSLGSVFAAMGKAELAGGQYEEAAMRYHDIGQNMDEAHVEYNLAALCAHYGNLVRATQHAEKVVALDPANYKGTYLLAGLLWAQEEQERALSLAKVALAMAKGANDEVTVQSIETCIETWCTSRGQSS